jgi:hypothetical protein
MAATACRYIVRHDTSATVAQLRMIHSVLDGLERLLRGAPEIWGQHFLRPFDMPDPGMLAWVSQLRGYIRHMLALYPRIEVEVGHPLQPVPIAQIEALLALANNNTSANL